ncbi:methyltransferase domain-containing protein [Salininema proteolyticum]|uniref:Protein-L-isoaspartate O-methyltransferase n=1 Tax=Salininema proteolyticum TaxID=1607685 RepID=A0ABV8U4I4_9ACTN
MTATDTLDADRALRDGMVDRILDTNPDIDASVAEAMRAVPRHRFAPEAPLEECYDGTRAVVTKRDDDGRMLSSVSAPWLVAHMLTHAGVEPGSTVLEIGAGQGYQAALLCELVGPNGHVITVDIDGDLCRTAQRNLSALGYANTATVVEADGAEQLLDDGTVDAVIVATGAWDLSPAWEDQLKPGGRLVTPLTLRGMWRGMTLEKADDGFACADWRQYGFIRMRGLLGQERDVADESLPVDVAVDPDHPGTADELRAAMEDRDPVVVATGVRDGRSDPAIVNLWDRIGFHEPETVRVTRFRRSAFPLPPVHLMAPALWEGSSFAYVGAEMLDDGAALSAVAFGPEKDALAERLRRHVENWGRDKGFAPRIAVRRNGGPLPSGLAVVQKTRYRVESDWSAAGR